MNSFSRAVRYVFRNPVKNVILLIIMSLAVFMVLVALSTLQIVRSERADIAEKTKARLTIATHDSGPALTQELLDEIGLLDNIASTNRQSTLATNLDHDLPVPGGAGTPDNQVTLHSYDDTRLDSPFEGGQLRLVAGDHPGRDDGLAVIVHHEFARLNGLSVGDSLIFRSDRGEPVDAAVSGLFLPVDGDGVQGATVLTRHRSENQVYGTTSLAQALGTLRVFDQAALYLQDPRLSRETLEAVAAAAPEHDAAEQRGLYLRMAGALDQIDRAARLVLVLTAATAMISLTLLLTLWMRGRMHEFAIYQALGRPSVAVLTQPLAEVWLVFTIALPLAAMTAMSAGGTVARHLLAGTTSSPHSGAASATFLVGVGTAGYALLAMSVLLSMLPLWRASPRDILATAD